MQIYFHTVIKDGRLKAGLSKVAAARLLNVSERTLASYENGSVGVDDEMAVRMAQVYKYPAIIYYWTNTFVASAVSSVLSPSKPIN